MSSRTDRGMSDSTHDGRRAAILAIDCATTRVVVATGTRSGTIDGLTTWTAGYRHGETLLPTIGRFLGEQNIRRSRLAGIVVGTGPGAFTGLRVGLATAKGLAHGLRLPIVGVSTGEALLAAATARDGADATATAAPPATPAIPAASDPATAPAAATGPAASPTTATIPVLLLPAGPSDRIVVRHGRPPLLLVAGTEPELAPGETLVAVDLDGRADPAAVQRGEAARAGLGAALITLGAARLAAGDVDDLAGLVPEYVTLPRGVRAAAGEVSWSHDPR